MIKALTQDLRREEKALAEVAALVQLRKKWESMYSQDAGGSFVAHNGKGDRVNKRD